MCGIIKYIKHKMKKGRKMKNIYFVLTTTGTVLSKIIRAYTKDEFAHVSISLDKDLKQMYSFGRLNPYNPFIGGFVHEYIDKGTFKRFKNTKTVVFELPIEDNQYEKINNSILSFDKNKEDFTFNLIGLFAVGFNIKYTKENSFYCAEFVKYITEESDIDLNLPDLIRPENFKNIKHIKEIYKGLLREYTFQKKEAFV